MATAIPIVAEVGDKRFEATLFYKKAGSPGRMVFMLQWPQARGDAVHFEHVNSAPMHLRCAVAQSLPEIYDAIHMQHVVAQTKLKDAIQSAAAFLEKMQ